jgi:hypothetical protein
MTNDRLLRDLVPDLPAYRRTEGDRVTIPGWEQRATVTPWLMDVTIAPGLQRPSLISSFAGTIEQLLFALPSYALADQALVAGYRSVIGALRHGTRFVVVHHDTPEARASLQAWFRTAGHADEAVEYVALPEYVGFTDWAEDAYVALRDAADDSRYLMEPWEFHRAGDALLAEAVAELGGLRAAQAPLVFQGGNCLIGDTFWLLGKDYFADSVDLVSGSRPPINVPSGTTPDAFVRRVFRDYVDHERELILLGTTKPIPLRSYYGRREGTTYFLDVPAEGAGTFQPIFHIDMFVTLAGRGADGRFHVRVGSPRLGANLLGTSAPYALDDVYDGIAADLAKRDMVVTRNPLVHRATLGGSRTLDDLRRRAAEPDGEALRPAIDELARAGASGATPIRIRQWHHVTWNNCLVEVSGRVGKHVYLPTFGHGDQRDLAAVDQAMIAIWEADGFQVHQLADFNAFARRQGVVHCIKKYLARGGE